MLKKLLMLIAVLVLSLSAGLAAAVEVNSADQAALESVKGIGPVHAKAIIDERTKNGPFKDADDLANRVKGIGQKSVKNLEAAGLTINGSSAPPTGAPAKAPAGTMSKSAPAPAATTAQTPAPAEAASGGKASKSKKSKADAAAAASAPATASDTTASKSKKSKKSKAASAASGV
ncbi:MULTISPECIES: ComEA family DNA-binding protein [Paraburkholderia]|uniref:Competence protein ComE n=1 Tax=Paraburkholderia caribensis TaxID=75105 RepID=A0A9Q6S3C1_9BURK|nr:MULTISPECIES: helix-hairpin-helix domain-containing protein [Paraburkholderia]ALP64148.1 competence protein ComE [Paraburkholderia caribensis]AUT53431.1 competence protein ComE [Paraburkholderia caribensis]MCO4880019.1 helix-hairpin-helix domain-containing protein [Paraburkholderia caribensis]PTB24676.1 competence protein ComE [Paraburkholderia caribensis]QLB63771.1 competence protein ComE [Paraburkholderia caribensis]